jgi:hypothetical protein
MNIHGYAILSRNDCIADARGHLPAALMNDADWRYFQDELDLADLVIVGRASHEAAPNSKMRNRLILSRRVDGLQQLADGWWWNPDAVAWPAVIERLDLVGRRLAVPGGQAVFDYFLAIGFAAFHLSRALDVVVDNGRKVFGSGNQGISAEAALLGAGLEPRQPVVIDADAQVTLKIFERPAVSAD